MLKEPQKLPQTGWHFVLNGETVGPVSLGDLQNRLYDGRLPLQTLVWVDGLDDWATAESLGIHMLPGFEGTGGGSPEAMLIEAEAVPEETAKEPEHLPLSNLTDPADAANWQKSLSVQNPFVRETQKTVVNPQVGNGDMNTFKSKSEKTLSGLAEDTSSLEPLDEMAPMSHAARPVAGSRVTASSAPQSSMNSAVHSMSAQFQNASAVGRVRQSIQQAFDKTGLPGWLQKVMLLCVLAGGGAFAYLKFGKSWELPFPTSGHKMPPANQMAPQADPNAIPVDQPALSTSALDLKGLKASGTMPVLLFFVNKDCAECPELAKQLDKLAKKNAARMEYVRINVDAPKLQQLRTQAMVAGAPALRLYSPQTKQTFEVITAAGPKYVQRRINQIFTIAGTDMAAPVEQTAPPDVAPVAVPKSIKGTTPPPIRKAVAKPAAVKPINKFKAVNKVKTVPAVRPVAKPAVTAAKPQLAKPQLAKPVGKKPVVTKPAVKE